MTPADINQAFATAGIRPPPALGNAAYDPVDLAFVQGVWGAAVNALPDCLITTVNGQRQPRYVLPSFDCLQMSVWLMAFMIIAVAEDAVKTGKPRNPPATGPLFYLIGGDPAQGHAVDWCIDYPAIGQTVGPVMFFEKQTGEEVTLSAVERASVFYEAAA